MQKAPFLPILEPELTNKAFRQNWAIVFIEDPDVIKKILKHLNRWDMKQKPRPTANAPPIDAFPVYDEQPGTGASTHWEKNKNAYSL